MFFRSEKLLNEKIFKRGYTLQKDKKDICFYMSFFSFGKSELDSNNDFDGYLFIY